MHYIIPASNDMIMWWQCSFRFKKTCVPQASMALSRMPSTVRSEGRIIFTVSSPPDDDQFREEWNLACVYYFLVQYLKVLFNFFDSWVDESKDGRRAWSGEPNRRHAGSGSTTSDYYQLSQDPVGFSWPSAITSWSSDVNPEELTRWTYCWAKVSCWHRMGKTVIAKISQEISEHSKL